MLLFNINSKFNGFSNSIEFINITIDIFIDKFNIVIDKLIKSSLKLAEKNIDTIMPGFTHLKNAQAISFAHYLMAYVEMFSRDKKRGPQVLI